MKLLFQPCRASLGFACALLTLTAFGANDRTPPPGSPVIELPKFVVTDSRDLPAPESWRYAEAPGLEILSKASEAHTRRFARNFFRLQQVTEIVWPAILEGAPAMPAMLILCDGSKVFDSFVPKTSTAATTTPTSLLLHEQEKTVIVVDVVREKPDDRVSLDAPIPFGTEPATGEEEVDRSARFMTENDPYREFYLQYFRLTIRRRAGQVAPWLEEGLVQLLASIDFSKDYIAVGRLRDGAGGQKADEFNVQLARRPLLPLDQMFARERPNLDLAPSYPAQCYAFVHLCLYGRRGRFQPALVKFATRSLGEPVSEKLFRECFGLGYEAMATELRGYLSYTAHQYVEYRLDKSGNELVDAATLSWREASQAEIGRIKGEAYQLGGHNERAHTALLAPYIRNERDPRLLAALGLHERARGQDERALALLDASVQAQVPNPRAHLELARLRFSQAKAKGGTQRILTAETSATVLAPLRTAVRQSPLLPEVFELMGEVWAISERSPSAEDMALLYGGAQRFPRRLRLVYLVAALSLRHGTTEHARALIEHGLQVAGDSEVSQHFKALRAQLPK